MALAQSSNPENVLGVYIFHRHGDRTPKSTPPANLTDLGYRQVYTSGQYYRNRYVASDAGYRINGINPDIVKQSQIAVSAPVDVVLQNSATGFLQGLYPPVGSALGKATLRNGTSVAAPMDGYQLIPVEDTTHGTGSEDTTWLQSASGCAQAIVSSNNYFSSKEYTDLLFNTRDFYSNIYPVVNGTFNESQVSFKNAYSSKECPWLHSHSIKTNCVTVYDLINVAEIHNASIPSSDLLTDDVLFQLRTLADSQQWGLAYNASDDMRAIAGKTLAGQIVEFLNGTLTGNGKQKIGVQFGAYATFASFFGLADLPSVNPDFRGVSDYASAMTFEMFTNSSVEVTSTEYPSTDEVYVRFLFHNGTTTENSEPVAYPLFGSGREVLPWKDFTSGMAKFAVSSTEEWCMACGNTTGTCAAYGSADSSSTTASTSDHGSGNGLSPVVNGVIGAMVTLAVVLGLEAMVLVVGGFRVVRKKSLARDTGLQKDLVKA
jgi:hypothetical protein